MPLKKWKEERAPLGGGGRLACETQHMCSLKRKRNQEPGETPRRGVEMGVYMEGRNSSCQSSQRFVTRRERERERAKVVFKGRVKSTRLKKKNKRLSYQTLQFQIKPSLEQTSMNQCLSW